MTYFGILILYLVFRAKQMICDFVLQDTYMVTHKHRPWREGAAKALFQHCGIHAVFTLAIVLYYAPQLWWLSLFDFFLHAGIDRLKGILTHKAGWTYNDHKFWVVFGLDQEAHNLSHLLYLVLIVATIGIAA